MSAISLNTQSEGLAQDRHTDGLAMVMDCKLDSQFNATSYFASTSSVLLKEGMSHSDVSPAHVAPLVYEEVESGVEICWYWCSV